MKKLIGLLIVVAMFSFASFAWYRVQLKAPHPDAPLEIFFTIEKGATLNTVADQLQQQGIIKNAFVFKRLATQAGKDRTITAGRFTLSPSMSATRVLETVTSARTIEPFKLMLPEGITFKGIADLLVQNKLATRDEINMYLVTRSVVVEGTLFPDTYYVDPTTFTATSFFNRLSDTFNKKTAALQAEAQQKNIDWQSVVSIASMLEKELKTPDDYQIVSGILWKRLEGGWPMGVDTTLLYIDEDGTLSPEDLTRDSLYNTRLYPGLPPTPISNPGLKTLEAALRPVDSPYWFFIAEPEAGRIIYAKTLDEHERNVAKYLK